MILISKRFHEPVAAVCGFFSVFLRLCAAGLFFVFLALSFRGGSHQNLLKAAQCAGLFALSFLPRALKMERTTSAAFFSLFLLLAGILGSVLDFYERFAFYDVFIHSLSGAVCVLFVFDAAKKSRFPFLRAHFFAASLVLTLSLAAAWEMYEFVAFSLVPNASFSLRAIAGELGVPAAAQTAKSAVRETLSLSFGTIDSLLKNEYDTFCDVLCALLAAVPTAAVLKTRMNAHREGAEF